MKKFVLASMVALASMTLVAAPKLQAQGSDSGQITIKDPAEFNAYQMFSTQTDPKAKAAAGESFLKTYPQSVVKNAVLDALIDAYSAGGGSADDVLSAASRLLQVDPNNLKAIIYSVNIKKQQCQKTSDAQTCDDAAALAQKGLQVTKPASTSDDDWKKLTHVAFPIFHSTVALDDGLSKKDWKAAQEEYKAELNMLTPDEAKSSGLVDELQLAQAYSMPGSSQDLKQAVWYYARVWDYAPDQYKKQIEPKLEYYYKKHHGGLDGLDGIKQQAQASLTPPGTFNISLAKTPAEQIHDLIASTPDLKSLALADKETVLAMGSKEDADKLWGLVQGEQTPVPGVVIEVTADQVKVAVTEDAKAAKVPDFIVNMKKPLTDAELKTIVVGFEFKTQPDATLVGVYDQYRQVPATDKTSAAAEIVLKDGEYLAAEKKKPTKPAPAHHAPAHRPAHQ
jgi:hypothetical protein